MKVSTVYLAKYSSALMYDNICDPSSSTCDCYYVVIIVICSCYYAN